MPRTAESRDAVSGERSGYYPSPPEPDGWRRQLIYFLLPDRFSDGQEKGEDTDGAVTGAIPLRYSGEGLNLTFDPVFTNFPDSRYTGWRWDLWAISGRNRFQGGTIKGVTSKLAYLDRLGVTALWIGPVWKQRAIGVDQNLAHDGTDDTFSPGDDLEPGATALTPEDVVFPSDTYHGYAVQDFCEVDSRFGSTADLIELVQKAHRRGIRVIFDILINHTGVNFCYDTPIQSRIRPLYPPSPGLPDGKYPFGNWLDVNNSPMPGNGQFGPDDAVWPEILRNPGFYSRQGEGDYGTGDPDQSGAQFRVADWRNRDLGYQPDANGDDPVLEAMFAIWSRWIEVTDCDGFRIDTFKHVPRATGARFVQRIRQHAKGLGKADFLMMGEVGGSDAEAAAYLTIEGLHVLELDARRRVLRDLAGGMSGATVTDVLQPTVQSVERLSVGDPYLGEALPILPTLEADAIADRTVTSIDDHDGLGLNDDYRSPGSRGRMARAFGAASVAPAAALLLFGPGVPQLYYGTEQALRGPADWDDAQTNLLGYQNSPDRYLREAMFGPVHPRRAGLAGRPTGRGLADDRDLETGVFDKDLPGFGPMGTTGRHAFREDSYWYRTIQRLAANRRRYPVLAVGRITVLSTGSIDGGAFGVALPAQIVIWQRRSAEGTAVIAMNVAAGDSTAYSLRQDVVVALPLDCAVARFTRCSFVPNDNGPRVRARSVPVVSRPQSGRLSLRIGPIAPGEVRVYVSAGAVAAGM